LQLFVDTLSCYQVDMFFDPVASTTRWSYTFPSAGSSGSHYTRGTACTF